MRLEIVERFQRRLQVARAGEIAGKIARRRLQVFGFVSQEWSQQPQQRAPVLHLAAEFMHRDRVGIFRAFDGVCAHRSKCRARRRARLRRPPNPGAGQASCSYDSFMTTLRLELTRADQSPLRGSLQGPSRASLYARGSAIFVQRDSQPKATVLGSVASPAAPRVSGDCLDAALIGDHLSEINSRARIGAARSAARASRSWPAAPCPPSPCGTRRAAPPAGPAGMSGGPAVRRETSHCVWISAISASAAS